MLLKQGVRAPSSLFLLLLRLKYKRDHDERRYPKKPQLYHSYLMDRQNCQNKLSLSDEPIAHCLDLNDQNTRHYFWWWFHLRWGISSSARHNWIMFLVESKFYESTILSFSMKMAFWIHNNIKYK